MLLSKNNENNNKDCYTYYLSFLIILIPIISKLLENTDLKSLFSYINQKYVPNISKFIEAHFDNKK